MVAATERQRQGLSSAMSVRTKGSTSMATRTIGRKRKTATETAGGKKGKDAGALKLKRACMACTKSKVKCIKKEGESSCLLCTKRGCECIYQPRRNRQKIRENFQKQNRLSVKGKNLIKGSILKEMQSAAQVHPSDSISVQTHKVNQYPTKRVISKSPDFNMNTNTNTNTNTNNSLHDSSMLEYDLDFVAEVLLDPEYTYTRKPLTLDMPTDENWELASDDIFVDDNNNCEINETYPLDHYFYDFQSNLSVR